MDGMMVAIRNRHFLSLFFVDLLDLYIKYSFLKWSSNKHFGYFKIELFGLSQNLRNIIYFKMLFDSILRKAQKKI